MNKFINESKRHFTLDVTLIVLLFALFGISLVAIHLAAPLMNQDGGVNLVIKQISWIVVGLGVVAFLLKIGVDRIFTAVDIAYWILMVCLVGLVIARVLSSRFGIHIPFAAEINGTHAWYSIPGIGSFQPSEFMKIVLVIKTANTIHEHNTLKTEYSFKSDFELIFKMIKYVLPPFILIFLQPDTGVPIVILVSLATMFFLSGVRREWFIVIVGLALGLLLGIVWLYYNNQELLNTILGGGATHYRLTRFYGWLDYEKYPQTYGYQLFQALLSLGTAGLTGHPLGSVIAQFPEPQTDFIFAVISQNFGFLGASLVVILSFAFDIKLVVNTLRSNLSKERYMMMGIIGMIVFQDLQNIGMILGILPITGITLPFISYGGSSLVSYMIPIAVALHMYSETVNLHKH
ncbi:FtsW/RodA/SpoVE family cell cycle protein [Erysipelothrix rhusiopathiae]|uniref:FtsW/RodA/SpoVE family cell cycle protein n=1 Tax=Erysipelothrix rhusiopathiae TaxID=1648 RepID=UPI001EDF594C|nr:FtsW/RodA/SpoVE family cell cycle protein [Erysipelothrix rhusiopathiae]MCG4457372.1 FtsW/RodA/SpoVE family cell cycle protein [Erysipelothrix rhusiopathiae]